MKDSLNIVRAELALRRDDVSFAVSANPSPAFSTVPFRSIIYTLEKCDTVLSILARCIFGTQRSMMRCYLRPPPTYLWPRTKRIDPGSEESSLSGEKPGHPSLQTHMQLHDTSVQHYSTCV